MERIRKVALNKLALFSLKAKETTMKNIRKVGLSALTLITLGASFAFADHDPWAEAMQMTGNIDRAILDLYQSQLATEQTMIDIRRQQTGDYTTPDAELARQLYIENLAKNPEAAQRIYDGNQAIMDSQAAYFETMQQGIAALGNAYDSLNAQWTANQQIYSTLVENFNKGVIQGEWATYNPNTGQYLTMPLNPGGSGYYQNYYGESFYFDGAQGTWYQVDALGYETALGWTNNANP